MTPAFYALQLLFQKTDAPQEAPVLIDLAVEGNWELLDRFTKEQTQLLDLSVEKRRRLLLSYLALHSRTAAELLIKTDFQFALKRLDDRGICDVLALLHANEESQQFCLTLLSSLRSDAVRQAAARKMYALSGETAPTPLHVQAAIHRFCPNDQETAEQNAPIPTPFEAPLPFVKAIRYHVVNEGESLWKIARLYKVKVDEIVEMNGIDRDRLYPGMTLRIPD